MISGQRLTQFRQPALPGGRLGLLVAGLAAAGIEPGPLDARIHPVRITGPGRHGRGFDSSGHEGGSRGCRWVCGFRYTNRR